MLPGLGFTVSASLVFYERKLVTMHFPSGFEKEKGRVTHHTDRIECGAGCAWDKPAH